MFTDRTRRGGKIFAPTELDVIGGLTSTHVLGKGFDAELGARFEADLPIDRGRLKQIYADVRGRLLYSLGDIWPGIGRELVGGDVSGYATLGWFAVNPTYAARPNNEGLALFRYVNHTELSVWKRHVGVAIDTTFFTDRRADVVVRPTELDLTYELIGRADPWEVHLAYERDMPIDRDRQRATEQIHVDVQRVAKQRQAGVVRARGVGSVHQRRAERRRAGQAEAVALRAADFTAVRAALFVERVRRRRHPRRRDTRHDEGAPSAHRPTGCQMLLCSRNGSTRPRPCPS